MALHGRSTPGVYLSAVFLRVQSQRHRSGTFIRTMRSDTRHMPRLYLQKLRNCMRDNLFSRDSEWPRNRRLPPVSKQASPLGIRNSTPRLLQNGDTRYPAGKARINHSALILVWSPSLGSWTLFGELSAILRPLYGRSHFEVELTEQRRSLACRLGSGWEGYLWEGILSRDWSYCEN